MATIRRIDRTKKPAAFSNHVLIERVPDGYNLSGASNVNQYVTQLSKPNLESRDEALREAFAWAIEHAIPEIFVVEEIEGEHTHGS